MIYLNLKAPMAGYLFLKKMLEIYQYN